MTKEVQQQHRIVEKQLVELTNQFETFKQTTEAAAMSAKQVVAESVAQAAAEAAAQATNETNATQSNNIHLLKLQQTNDIKDLHQTCQETIAAAQKECNQQVKGLRDKNAVLVVENKTGEQNFVSLKQAYEEMSKERAELRTGLASATDVVRRQKDVLRRQASEIVTKRKTIDKLTTAVEKGEKEHASSTNRLLVDLNNMKHRMAKEMVSKEEMEQLYQQRHGQEVLVALQEKENAHRKEMQQQTSGFETKNKLLNANISTLNQSLNAIKKKLKDRNEKEESQESQKQVKALKTEMANLQMLVQIKEKQLDDTAETIVGLKKGLKKEEHRRREAEDRVDRKIQLYKQEKNVKRDLQEEKEDLQAELEESSLQVVNLKLSFKAIRGHLEAIIEEQVSDKEHDRKVSLYTHCFSFVSFSLFVFHFQSEELKQHAENNAGDSLRRELLNKDNTIRSIEQQVKELSEHYQKKDLQVKASDEKYQALVLQHQHVSNTIEQNKEAMKTNAIKCEEIENRYTTATSLVRSLKAELVRMERRVKDLEEEASKSVLWSKRQTQRYEELEMRLVQKDKESTSLRKKAKQATSILQQLGNLTSSP